MEKESRLGIQTLIMMVTGTRAKCKAGANLCIQMEKYMMGSLSLIKLMATDNSLEKTVKSIWDIGLMTSHMVEEAKY
jgi:hypothetical protein